MRKYTRQALAPETKNKPSLYFPAASRHQAPQLFLCFLPFSVRDQKRVVASPSLNSPQQSGDDGWCWANLQNTHFSGLTRKNPVFKRSVLKYVSIKNRILTPSGQKSRVCVNQPDRLLHPIHACLFCPSGTRFRPPAKLGRLRDAG